MSAAAPDLVELKVHSPATPSSARLERELLKKMGQAIGDHQLIEEGDRLMVCVSGGKDSYALLDLLIRMRRRAPIQFDIIAVNVDQGWPGYATDVIEAHLGSRGVSYRMVDEHFASIVEEKLRPGQTPCVLCSRLRRGVLYNLAEELECSKIALGHHRDDLLETLILNLMFSGRLAAMPAKLRSDDGRNTVIRPLAYVPEQWIESYSQQREFPVVSCGCPSCGLPQQKRQTVKRLLSRLEEENPGMKNHMFAALSNVSPSHLLDTNLAKAQKKAKDSRGPAF